MPPSLPLSGLLVFTVFKTSANAASFAKTKKRLLSFDVDEKVLVKKERTKVISVFPFTSILSYVADTETCNVTVEFVKQVRNGLETR